MSHPSIFSYTFTIPQSVIDENGHVNNVAFVQWMQDAAIRHGQERLAGYNGYNLNTTFVLNQNATFVVREHRIEYLLPVFLGEEIEVRTWLNEARRVRLHRRYEFVRKSDQKVVAKGETDWVYVDMNTGRPIAIPTNMLELFPVLPDPSKEQGRVSHMSRNVLPIGFPVRQTPCARQSDPPYIAAKAHQ